MISKNISARETALDTIYRVHESESYANLLLPKVLEKSGLSKRDRAFTTELVYGTLRTQGTLDWILSQYASRDLSQIPLRALDILRLGCYQLVFLSRVPAHAVCFEAVELAKKFFHRGMATFVNGLLRTVERRKLELPWPKYEEDPVNFISLKFSHPRWLVRVWAENLGLEETKKLCEANNRRPQITLRTNTLRISRDDLFVVLQEQGLNVEKSSVTSESLIIKDTGSLSALPQFKEGLFFVQDGSSMIASYVVSPRSGEVIIDSCAAPGGKSTHLAQLMGNRGRIIAVDIHPKRLNLIQENVKRLGTDIVETVQADATKLEDVIELRPLLKAKVDRILIDAPCSGLGVLARRPDARWRKSPDQIEELSILQSKLLESAAPFVKSGGVLVYSVCTITHQEGVEVVQGFLRNHPEFVLDDAVPYLPESLRLEEPYKWAQLLPHKHGTDGLFIARLVKKLA